MERNSPLVLLACCLIGLLGCVRVATVDAEYIECNKEIKEAWVEAHLPHREPEQVYECLKRIQQVYASVNLNDLNQEDQQMKETYDDLFNAWEPTPTQCNSDDFSSEDNFERYALVGSIGSYWRHCERKRIQVCEPVLEEQLKTEVDLIDEAQRQQVKLLVDSVMSECAPPAQPWYTIKKEEERDKVLTAGTLKYLETLEGPLSKSVFKFMGNSRDRFTGVYKRLVGDLCSMVFNTGKKQMKIFKVIKKHTASWEPTGLIGQWMQAERICSNVFLSDNSEMTFQLLRKKTLAKGLFGRGRSV